MRVTSKGQVTIPQELRRKANIVPESEVEFWFENGVIHLRKKVSGKSGRGRKVVARMKANAKISMSTEQIMKLTRGE